jgi:Na+-driven multidrug efflux pump
MYKQLTFWLGIIAALVFLASLGAFFLYVPVLSVMTVGTTLFGLILMFILGIHTGSRGTQIPQPAEQQNLSIETR